MAHGHTLAINLIGLTPASRWVVLRAAFHWLAKLWREVGDDLVPIEVKVDPFGARPAFGAAKQLAVKAPRGGKVMDGDGKMERMHAAKFAWIKGRVNLRICGWKV